MNDPLPYTVQPLPSIWASCVRGGCLLRVGSKDIAVIIDQTIAERVAQLLNDDHQLADETARFLATIEGEPT